MEKSGISTVIATVLIVLITVASVAILWTSVQPIVSRAEFSGNSLARFEIDKAGSFTFYDSETGYLSTRITRGRDNDDPAVIALKFVIDIDGNSIARKTYNVMPPNHALVYYFLIGFNVNLNSVKVIPIYIVNGEEQEGEPLELKVRIPLRPGELKSEVGELPIVPSPDNPVTDGLVLYYSFDALYSNATSVLDQSGEGHTGEVSGDSTIANEAGREFVYFDGAGDYVVVADGAKLAEATRDDKTVTFWANFDCPIELSNSNQAPFGSYENYFVNFVDPCNTFVDSEVRVNFDMPPVVPRSYSSEGIWNDIADWEFYAIVLDRANGVLHIYRNGELVASQPDLSIGSIDPNPFFYVGTVAETPAGGPDPTYYFKGGLDDLRVYSRTLSPAEIQKLYTLSL